MLLNSEIKRCKLELGYPLEASGAEPYIGIVAVFEQVVQAFLDGGATTTSSTAVSVQDEPTPVTIEVALATGFSLFDHVTVDVDSRRETATVSLISGTSVTLMLKKPHSGTYPVAVEGGESIVRDILSRIAAVKEELLQNFGAGALKSVDEISFYSIGNKTLFGTLGENLMFWRDELSGAIGVPNAWHSIKGSNGALSVY